MSNPDQGSTPGLRDRVAQDAARLAAEGEPDAWGAVPEEGVSRAYVAEWLRSDVAKTELLVHHLTDIAGKCGCGQPYTSHARHLLDALARRVERE